MTANRVARIVIVAVCVYTLMAAVTAVWVGNGPYVVAALAVAALVAVASTVGWALLDNAEKHHTTVG